MAAVAARAAALALAVGALDGACQIPRYALRVPPDADSLDTGPVDASSADTGSLGVAPPDPGSPECGAAEPGMRCIPSGTFAMGTESTDFLASKPIHDVVVAAFRMDTTEVTVAAYRRCVQAGVCRAVDGDNHETNPGMCNFLFAGRDQHPVDCVDWNDAKVFCAWAGKRLPTEEEWEYAAQRPGGRTYPWGEDKPSRLLLNACGLECRGDALDWNDGYPETATVGSFPDGKTADGLLDMAGNVWEWTSSHIYRYPSDPCQACDPSSAACINPCESGSDPTVIMRGGGAGGATDAEYQVFERGAFNRYNRWALTGFRCAR